MRKDIIAVALATAITMAIYYMICMAALADGIRRFVMITFISGMAAGADALLGIFKICFVRWERMERNKRRRAKRAAQNKPRGFCGDIRRDNSWMQETTRL